MELKDRFDVLSQAAQIAQKNGVLSLDDAVVVKNAIDNITNNKDVKLSVSVLVKVATMSQSKGAYSLKDAYLIYLAINGIDELIQEDNNPEEGAPEGWEVEDDNNEEKAS